MVLTLAANYHTNREAKLFTRYFLLVTRCWLLGTHYVLFVLHCIIFTKFTSNYVAVPEKENTSPNNTFLRSADIVTVMQI